MTKRLALAAAAALLSLPASALAASSSGLVLTVNGRHHALQLVNARHVVREYRFHGGVRGVGLGSRVRIEHSGREIRRLVAKRRRARTVSFLARVVRIGSGNMVVRLGDRRIMRLRTPRFHVVWPRRRALAAGRTVLVAVSVRSHRRRRVASKPGARRPGNGGEAQASGTVVELDTDVVAVQAAGGAVMRFAVPPGVVTNLQLSLCATIAVGYHGRGSKLTADTVQSTDAWPTGQCVNADNGGGSGASGQDVVGTITQLTLSSVTVSTTSGALISFQASLGDIDNLMIGDQVDVTYNPGSHGVLVETAIDYQSDDAIGTVTSVESGSITLVDSATGHVETFTDDPANQTFDGIAVGDQVDVSYHLSAAGIIVDSVSDLTNS